MQPAEIALFEFPRFTPAESYESVADRLARELGREQSVVSVYQMGNVSAPGISDLDLVAVFEDGAGSTLRPRTLMNPDAQYLFVHGIFGVSASQFEEALRYTLFDGLRLRWGRELRANREPKAIEAPVAIRRQVAAEYLVANYLTRTVEATYRLVSVRHLLLWGNALRYDLALLGVTAGALHALLQELQDWRTRWFARPPRPADVGRWFSRLVPELHTFLEKFLTAHPLGMATVESVSYARHIRVCQARTLSWRHRGVVCHRRLVSLDRRFYRMQHRFNRFEFHVPCARFEPGSQLERRSQLFDELVAEQEHMYPGFSPFTNGWHARVRRAAPSAPAA